VEVLKVADGVSMKRAARRDRSDERESRLEDSEKTMDPFRQLDVEQALEIRRQRLGTPLRNGSENKHAAGKNSWPTEPLKSGRVSAPADADDSGDWI